MQVGHGHFCGGHQKMLSSLSCIHVFPEFWQLSGPHHARLAHQKRRRNLRVPMGSRMQIQHPGNQRSLQLGSSPLVNRKATPGNFGRRSEIQDSQGLPQSHVISWLEIKFLRFPPGRHHRIIRRRTSLGTSFPRQIRNGKKQSLLLGLHLRHFSVQLGDPVRLLLHPFHQIVRRLPFCLPTPDLLADRIPLRLQLLHLPHQLPALLIRQQNLGQAFRRCHPTGRQTGTHPIRVLANQGNIEHSTIQPYPHPLRRGSANALPMKKEPA